MKSCQAHLSELREKIILAEDQLRSEKKNFYRSQELFNEERDKWNAEIKEEEIKIRSNEIQIKEKEAELDQLRGNYEEVVKKCTVLEVENEKLNRDLQNAKIQREGQLNLFMRDQANVEAELSKLQEEQREVKTSSKWAKIFQDKEMKAHEAEWEDRFKEEQKELSDDLLKKMEAFDENLMEIDVAVLEPKKQQVAALQEELLHATNQCKDFEEKIKALEKQIELLD